MNEHTATMHATPADVAGIPRRTRGNVGGATRLFPTPRRPRRIAAGGAALPTGGAAWRL